MKDKITYLVTTEKVVTSEGLLRGLQAIPLKGDRSSDAVRTAAVGMTPEGRSPYGISSQWGFSVRTNYYMALVIW